MLSDVKKEILKTVLAFGFNGGLIEATPASVELQAEGYLEVNVDLSTQNSMFCRVSEKAVNELQLKNDSKPVAKAQVKTYGNYVIRTDRPLPTEKTRARRKGEFPFDSMEVGESFFVPNSESRPDAAKSMASTVSSAISRFSEDDPKLTRKNRKGESVPVKNPTRVFVVTRGSEDGVQGAVIFRTR